TQQHSNTATQQKIASDVMPDQGKQDVITSRHAPVSNRFALSRYKYCAPQPDLTITGQKPVQG
ncbi:hypothetical protein JV213_00580, partial [Plesiomonas shigelloides]|uniref:hypothetical protein n=1 Tax=Plesiomonas shigelloides TaxID=703 RepID=UPI001C0422BC